ncbi:hypothetical protein COO91_10565 (plasmid) [Nostoc flagelliforme CCNUN1]|uniref:Uncharacterized protein n=1 Tax=Nostoc flagelliforme CCNUN1 TaxID=2038116 RepID=A0A2K8T9J5_9NOSO|nr:hypothetical protein COO91_10565 [Nostoc flagelliforme CCNUN1]
MTAGIFFPGLCLSFRRTDELCNHSSPASLPGFLTKLEKFQVSSVSRKERNYW